VITENNASLYQYPSHPDLNYQFQENKKYDNGGRIPSIEQWTDDVHNGIQDNHKKEIDQSLHSFSEQNEKIQRQEERLQTLERKMKSLLTQQEACSDMLLKFNFLESQLRITSNENKDLRKSLAVLQETLIYPDQLTNKNISDSQKEKEEDSSSHKHPILHRNRRNIDYDTQMMTSTLVDDVNSESIKTSTNSKLSDTKMVAFDAFRNKPFHEDQKYITFDGMKVNVGGGFNPDTGMFKAPVGGIYSFSFHGLTQDGTATYVKLVHKKADEENWDNVAGTYRRHEKEDEELESPTSNHILKNAEGMLALSVLLEIGEGDEVAVFSYHGNLRDGGWHYTHFTGYLLR